MINRIKRVIDYSGLSVRAFAIKLGLNQPTLDRMLKGINALSLSCVTAVLASYPEVSAEWLVRGEGEMLKTEAATKESARLSRLVDTIATLQDAINAKSDALRLALDRIKTLESQIKKIES